MLEVWTAPLVMGGQTFLLVVLLEPPAEQGLSEPPPLEGPPPSELIAWMVPLPEARVLLEAQLGPILEQELKVSLSAWKANF
jgi:hypothetical protein